MRNVLLTGEFTISTHLAIPFTTEGHAMPTATKLLLTLATIFLMAGKLISKDPPNVYSEWSQFRGPNGSGVAEAGSLPTEFNKSKNLKWMTPLPAGHSSPVVFGGRIYVTASEGESLLTICLEQSTGKELWRQTAPRDRKETLDPRNNPASPTPVVDASGVYVMFPDFGLLGYSLDGKLKWQSKLGPFSNIYGMGASPILCEGRLILICDQNVDSTIAAYDLEKGTVLWKTARAEATSGHCTPIVYRPKGWPHSNHRGRLVLLDFLFRVQRREALVGWWPVLRNEIDTRDSGRHGVYQWLWLAAKRSRCELQDRGFRRGGQSQGCRYRWLAQPQGNARRPI